MTRQAAWREIGEKIGHKIINERKKTKKVVFTVVVQFAIGKHTFYYSGI